MSNMVLVSPVLTMLRAAAVVFVVLFHLPASVVAGGYVGVDVFFLLSGYLIARKFFDGENVGVFYRKRLCKIFPSLVVVVSFVVFVFWYVWGWCEDTLVFLWHGVLSVLGVSNVFYAVDANTVPFGYSPFLHLWSVAVELQFYLVAPLLFLWLRRVGSPRRVLLSVVGFSFFMWVVLNVFDYDFAYYFTVSRLWEFGLGVLVAAGFAPRVDVGYVKPVVLVSVLTVVGFLFTPVVSPTLVVLPVFAVFMLLVLAHQGLLTTRSFFLVDWTARVSYPLYLIHYPVFFYVSIYFPEYVLVGFVFSVLAAWFIHVTVEKPLLYKG